MAENAAESAASESGVSEADPEAGGGGANGAGDPGRRWHPIAAADDLVLRHVYHGKLLGRELAVWRADDGFVNVWENRCLHRGVRLSIGVNDGRELVCAYHGWRYANRTAGCTYIPAHPADAPARTICNRTFGAAERYGLIWSGEEPDGEIPGAPELAGETLVLRSLPVNAGAALAIDWLAGYEPESSPRPVRRSEHATALEYDDETAVVFFVQPVDSDRSVIRPVLAPAPPDAERIEVLRRHSTALEALRKELEAEAAKRPPAEPMTPALEQVPVHLAEPPEPSARGRQARLRVQVARKWNTAADVAAFELESIAGQLPTFQPGAHIDVHLPGGLVRQYSLTNGPGQLDRYRIGVKLEPESRGGSEAMHHTVREGDVLAISEPRNNFLLRRNAERTILLAGGIGITPLLAMAQALHHSNLAFELHCFARSRDHLAFGETLERLGDSVTAHLGLSPADTAAAIARTLEGRSPSDRVYGCGPAPMLAAVRELAEAAGWPEEVVHFEYFANPTEIDDSSSFEVSLARSALTLAVPAGRTVLEVLRDNGVDVASSCEQGACGTCSVGVIEGEPDHQDVYLNESEKQRGDRMMVCISRARGPRLILDL